MKHQASFSSKDIGKKIKVLSAAILLDALRVKFPVLYHNVFFPLENALRYMLAIKVTNKIITFLKSTNHSLLIPTSSSTKSPNHI